MSLFGLLFLASDPATAPLGPYGPYAFGVVAVVVLAHTAIFAWQKIGKPALDTRLEIAKQATTQVQALERMQQAGEKMQQAGTLLMERLERVVEQFQHPPRP